MGLSLHALRELCGRYAQVLGEAWDARRELESPPRPADEMEFLPAHLEIVDTPVHPAPRWLQPSPLWRCSGTWISSR